MGNSADIRKDNKRAIYRFMLDGGQYTKNQVSKGTGLSVATCNTLLNDMQNQGLVTGGEKVFGEVGRSSVLYQIKEDHESYLALYLVVDHGKRFADVMIFSASGGMLYHEIKAYDYLDYDGLNRLIRDTLLKNPECKMTQMVIAMPGMNVRNQIKYCDIPELEGMDVRGDLEACYGVQVSLKNDMHFKALGYYEMSGNDEDVITLAYFPTQVLPGTATIHQGMIIQGTNEFAGMTGFLPYDMSRDEQLGLLQPETCVPFITESIRAIIVLLNPATIVFTGNLLSKNILDTVRKNCLLDIPEEFMPQFRLVDDFNEYCYQGMFQAAIAQKKF